MTRDDMPEPVTERETMDRLISEVALPPDALERLGLLPLDTSGLTVMDGDALGLPVLEEVATDLVDLDRLIAETVTPLEDATVVALVAETLDRDPLA